MFVASSFRTQYVIASIVGYVLFLHFVLKGLVCRSQDDPLLLLLLLDSALPAPGADAAVATDSDGDHEQETAHDRPSDDNIIFVVVIVIAISHTLANTRADQNTATATVFALYGRSEDHVTELEARDR